jgi:CheY-like chemotaxis protein
MARGEDGGKILTWLKADPLLRDVPMVALTETIDDETRARAFGADACCMKPADHEQLSETLNRLIRDRGKRQILVIDDEEISRYVLKGLLINLGYPVLEARGGEEGIILACECQPQVIFLDLIMEDLSGYEVLERLAANPVTGGIPVLIITSKVLADHEHQKLGARAVAVLSKSVLAEEQTGAKIEEALRKAGVEKPKERI